MHIDRRSPAKPTADRRRDQAIDPVHHAAVAGDERACILRAEPALDAPTPARSPACATKDSIAADAGQPQRRRASGTANQKQRADRLQLAARAPIRPAQVLLGETRGHSFGPPNSRPLMKPAVSAGDDDDDHEHDGQQPKRGDPSAAR